MRLFQLIFISIILVFVYSCKQNTSTTSQITIKTDCTVNKEQASSYYEKYGKNNSKITLNSSDAANYIGQMYKDKLVSGMKVIHKKTEEEKKKLTKEEKKQVENEEKQTEEAIKQAFELLSNVPEKYLEYVLGTSEGSHNIPINLIDYLVSFTERINGTTYVYPSAIGVTTRQDKEVEAKVDQYDASGKLKTTTTKVKILYPIAIQFTHPDTLTHEFGHAVEGYVQQQEKNLTNLKFKKDLETLSKEVLQTRNKDLVSPYLRSNRDPRTNQIRNMDSQITETFAELFDTWYCSQNARNILKAGIKNAYDFAVKYLEKPADFKERDTTDITYSEDKKTNTQITNLIRNKRIPSTCIYKNNRNATVYTLKDESTKRFWVNQGDAVRNWKEAYNYCDNLKIQNLSYRLPTVDELVAFSSTTCMYGSNRLLWTSSVPSSTPSSNTSISQTAYAVYRNDYYYKNITVYQYDKNRTELAFLCVSEQETN